MPTFIPFVVAFVAICFWVLTRKSVAKIEQAKSAGYAPEVRMAHYHPVTGTRLIDGVVFNSYSPKKCGACVAESKARKERRKVDAATQQKIRRVQRLRITMVLLAIGSLIGGLILLMI